MNKPSTAQRRQLLMGLGAALMAPSLHAQATYPTRPVRLVVPFAAGGPNDVMARILAQRLTQDLGQPFVVDNKAGAGGVIGTDQVAKSTPDGYTLAFVSGPFTMAAALQSKMPYDVNKDLAPLCRVADSPMLMMVPANSPYKSARELLQAARQQPEKLTYGSGGIGSTPHLTTELLASVTGARFMHVPYKGGGESIKALMAGEVDLLIDSITSTAGPLASGRVRALAIALPQRSPKHPDVPTFEEQGIERFSMAHWVGVVAPSRTPKDVLATLHGQIQKALKSPDVVQRLQELGASPVSENPADFQKFIQDDLRKWQQVVKTARIQAQ